MNPPVHAISDLELPGSCDWPLARAVSAPSEIEAAVAELPAQATDSGPKASVKV